MVLKKKMNEQARNNFFLFDVDGTLTSPRKYIDPLDTIVFLSWMAGKSVYLVTGSDRKKVMQQMPMSILARCEGVFCSMANQFFDNKRDCIVYSNDWSPPANLLNDLNNFLLKSEYDTKCGNHIEHRPGMINFSVVGREAGDTERGRYSDWDKLHKERASIATILRNKYQDLDVNIGGQISIDINPKGANKSQASKWIRENKENANIIFFGDKCFKGGNDYDICLDIQRNKDGVFWQVSGPRETLEILKEQY
jgi:phosphomannomutase